MIKVLVPIVGDAVLVNFVFEVTKRTSPPYRVAQIVTYIIILNRATEAFHDAVFVNVELGWQWEIMIRFQNIIGNADGVTLPFWKRFQRFLILRCSQFFMSDGDDLTRFRVQISTRAEINLCLFLGKSSGCKVFRVP